MLVKGRGYYNKGAVLEVGTMSKPQGTIVYAKIKGSKSYRTTISVDNKGVYCGSSCSCPFHRGTEGDICKHIAALYLHLTASEPKFGTAGRTERDFMEEIFEILETPSSKKKLTVRYLMEFDQGFGYSHWRIGLKIGLDKLYVVKNIKEFVECILEGKKLDFGKSFCYDPRLHQMNEWDKNVFEFIRQLYMTEMSYKAKLYGGSTGIFNGKHLILGEELFIKFCSFLGGRVVEFTAPGKPGVEVQLDLKELPFTIFIGSGSEVREDRVTATIYFPEEYIEFGRSDKVILTGNKLYVLDKNNKACDFYGIFSKRGIRTIEFQGEEKSRILTLLPQILGEKNIQIGEELTRSYIRADLKSSIYIDRHRKGIKLLMEFDYGGNKVNPFGGTIVNPFIIRNYAIENQIIRIIEDGEFKMKDGSVYLEDYDRIYVFFRDAVPMLQELCSIYYTDEVRNFYAGRVRSYKGYLKTNKVNGLIDIHFEMDDFDNSEVWELLLAIKERKNYHRLKSGTFVSLEGDEGEHFRKLLNYVDSNEIGTEGIQLSKYRAFSIFDNLRDFEALGIRDTGEMKELLDTIKNPSLEHIEVPEKLQPILRDYQITGFKWLEVLTKTGFGGVLADDMGLGKTIQTITLLVHHKQRGSRNSIVIAPSSLVYNWESEILKFAPELKTTVISGNRAVREDMIQEIREKDVVITSYPLLRRDIELYEDIDFELCILDEAQHIKNPESINAASVKRIKASHRFALTGTPMENSLIELWSIFDFLMPGYLYTRSSFSERFEKSISRGGDPDALGRLRRTIAPFILRRKKKDVLTELPDKIETKLICELTEEQHRLYQAYLLKAREELRVKIEEEGFDKNRIQILSLITRLRQICCHPGVFVENYNGGSGKLEMLEELLQELIDGEHRILLFSQFTSLLDIIRRLLEEKGIKYLYLDGSVPSYKRMPMVESFNEGEGSVFLISLKAGGTGLNLTSADVVIHFDPWWNPAVEDQASDRAHRIGQQNVVEVFKLITKDTIEEKIYELQNKKKDLINSVITEGESFINKLSEEEIMELFVS